MHAAGCPVPAWLPPLVARLGAQLVETHISWVLLAGDLALKIKKPLRLAFVDYGTLERRRACCEEELRLDRRLAPSLYLGLAAITGDTAAPEVDGAGPVLEYAVRMRRFPDGALFSERLAAGRLEPADVDALALLLARFHETAPAATAASGFATPQQRAAVARAALHGAAAAAGPEDTARLAHWLDAQAQALAPLWSSRLAQGRVREGHGDLHLANLVCLPEGVAAFDGVEFDPALRWIDVIDDLSFAVMDFDAQGRRDFAFRLLNGWLDATGDHAGLPLLRHAVVYRALVRAQVALLRADAAQARRYVDTALAWTQPREPRLTVMHGLPGSGKSWAALRLLEREGAVRLRSDVERKRLFGLAPLADSRAAGQDIYSAAAGEATYQRLFTLARGVLQAGYPVILDAAFLRRAERDRARALAHERGVPFVIAHCEAPPEVLAERLRKRRGDPSEADEAVLRALAAVEEPLSAGELAAVQRYGA